MFWFIVFLLMLGAVFYMYQNLKTMEKEIREEQQREQEFSDQQNSPKSEPASPPSSKAVPEPVAGGSEAGAEAEVKSIPASQPEVATTDSDNEILSLIKANPGIKQSELYAKVETMSTKQAQQRLKKMADSGEIKREKVASSYRLFLS